jgi:hypothetical protein
MAKNKLLNLDELATEEKVIKLDGADHLMREMTVQEFVDKAKAARDLEASAPATPETLDAKIVSVIAMIADAFPTITSERLGQLSLPQLNAILEFTIAPPEKIAAEIEATQGNA